MENQYIQILEKTNQQLSLWSNPYGIMVSVLTALFAVLTIISAFIIYRQGRDYKDAMSAFLKEQEEKANNGQKRLDALLVKYEEELIKSSNNHKKEFEDAIRDLQMQKTKIDTGGIAKVDSDSHKLIKVVEDGNSKKIVIFLPTDASQYTLKRLSKYLDSCPTGNSKVFISINSNTLETPYSIKEEPHILEGMELIISTPF